LLIEIHLLLITHKLVLIYYYNYRQFIIFLELPKKLNAALKAERPSHMGTRRYEQAGTLALPLKVRVNFNVLVRRKTTKIVATHTFRRLKMYLPH